MPYQKRILETGTTFAPEFDGTWQIIDFTGKGHDDLAFIKTFNTDTKSVEVHVASAESKYQTRIYQSGTTFQNEIDGTWQLVPNSDGGKPDLVFIKTANTPSGKVEVHIATGSSNYQKRSVETPTTFAVETDGTWGICDFTGKGTRDLYFIKTSNTNTKTVEVHVASAESNYKTPIYAKGTIFREETDGTWVLRPFSKGPQDRPDLVFVKDANAATKTTEVHVASASSEYKNQYLATGTTFKEETDGVWTFSTSTKINPNLIFIKTGPTTGTGRVEVHIASFAD